MSNQNIHIQHINRYVVRSKIWLAVLAIWGLIAIWVGVNWNGSHSFLSTTPEQPTPEKPSEKYEGIPFIVVGALFTTLGGYGVLTAHRYIQRAIRVYSDVSPKPAKATVTIDNMTDFAVQHKVVLVLAELEGNKEWHGRLHPPG